MSAKPDPNEATIKPEDMPPTGPPLPDAELVLGAAAAVTEAAIRIGNPWIKASLLEQAAGLWRDYALTAQVPPVELATSSISED